jgi:hypothetical protein
MEKPLNMQKIAPVMQKFHLHDHEAAIAAEREYWRTKTPEERLEALEFLRQQYIQLHFETPPTFQYVCRIIKRKPR